MFYFSVELCVDTVRKRTLSSPKEKQNKIFANLWNLTHSFFRELTSFLLPSLPLFSFLPSFCSTNIIKQFLTLCKVLTTKDKQISHLRGFLSCCSQSSQESQSFPAYRKFRKILFNMRSYMRQISLLRDLEKTASCISRSFMPTWTLL